MEAGNKLIYDGQFQGNILVVFGKTGCGKTHFLEKLGLNNFFANLVKTEWVAGIEIDKQREAEIQSCFSNKVEFHLATEPGDLVSLIEKFKLRTRDLVNNENNSVFGKKILMDCFIVMDDVSGVADNCKKFAEFLTIYRKYRYHCIYVFHIIAPESQIWKKNNYCKLIFLIFFHRVWHTILLLKSFKVIVYKEQKKMFLLLQCGSIGFLVTLPTQMNNIV